MRCVFVTDQMLDEVNADVDDVIAALPLVRLAEPQHYDQSLRAWTLKSLPILPEPLAYTPVDAKRFRALRKERVDEVVFVGVRVSSVACALRALDWPDLQVYRSDDSSLSTRTVVSQSELDAAWLTTARDWLIGINGTRAATRQLKRRGDRTVYMVGSVSTPLLAWLVARGGTATRAEAVAALEAVGLPEANRWVDVLTRDGRHALARLRANILEVTDVGRDIVEHLSGVDVPHVLSLEAAGRLQARINAVAAGEASTPTVHAEVTEVVREVVAAMKRLERRWQPRAG